MYDSVTTMGDFNAKIGRGVTKESGRKVLNIQHQ
jgi:hypothetical protein